MAENDIDVGFLIKKAFKLIVHDPGYVLLYLLPILVYIVAMVHMHLVVGTELVTMFQNFASESSSFTTQNSSELFNVLRESLLIIIGLGILYTIIGLIAGTVSIGGLIKKAEMEENGQTMSTSDALSFGIHVFPRLFAAMIVGMLAVAGPIMGLLAFMILSMIYNILPVLCLSSLLMVVVGILWLYIGFRLSLYPLACVLDNLGPIESLKKSWYLSKGNVILIFVTALILMIIYIAITIPFMIVGNVGLPYASSVGYIVAMLFFGPLYGIVFTLLYIRLSRKKSGIDRNTLKETTNINMPYPSQ